MRLPETNQTTKKFRESTNFLLQIQKQPERMPAPQPRGRHMRPMQKKAQARIAKWKSKFFKGWQIKAATGVDEATISRIFHGRGIVSDSICEKIVSAPEPTK
jgi:hypothetical protein